MKRASTQKAPASILLLALMTTAATFASPQTHVVVGMDNVAVDRTAIQSAIDGAQAGDTVELRGMFQLDGESILVGTSDLTIVGQSLDNDGDGAHNEDWADGIDNDGDGLVDEDDWDAILQGVDDGSGGPAGDAFPDRFNDGIEILGFDGALSGIEISDIKFTRLNRAIYLFPDYDDAGTVLACASSSPTSGELDDVEIEDNLFDNGNRGVELLGRIEKLSIEDNRFANMASQAIVMFGEGIGCAEADGSVVTILPLGVPAKTRIEGNQFTGGFIGVLSQVTEKTRLTCNQMTGQVLALVALEDEKLSVARNVVDGAFIGLLGSFEDRVAGPSSGNSFKDNSYSDNVFGIVIDCDTTGYKIQESAFAGSLFADVYLDGTAPGGSCGDLGLGDSFDNKAIVDSDTAIFDFGSNNQVIIDDDVNSEDDSDCDDDSDSD